MEALMDEIERDGLDHDGFLRLLGERRILDIQQIEYAYFLAKREHAKQTRDTGERYFEHPRRVAVILIEAELGTTTNIIASLLHDAMEDGFLPRGIIYNLLGGGMQDIVERLTKVYRVRDEVTDRIIARPKKPNEEYWKGIIEHPVTRVVKPADRLDNLRSCQGVWDKARIEKYVRETEETILPMALEYVPVIGRLIQIELGKLNAYLVGLGT